MALSQSIVQQLSIEFYNRNDASVKFENLSGQKPDDTKISYYFLTYYAKMLYNLGAGIDSQALHLYISDVAGAALYDRDRIDESLNLVDYKGKGAKTYSAEWDKNGAITTKVGWGDEDHYSKASVLVFLDFLNQSLPELSRQNLFYSIYEFQNAVSEFGIPDIKNIIGWPSQIVAEVERNLDEYHELRLVSEKEYRGKN
jgi:hypothetical protein